MMCSMHAWNGVWSLCEVFSACYVCVVLSYFT